MVNMGSPDTTNRPPNVMMIVVDCLRADRCGPAGQDYLPLKAWPKLREGGTVFTQAISSASWTPVCFAGLLSGSYSFVHGVKTIRGPAMDQGVATIATVLQQAGYSTNAFLTGPLLEVLGMDRGFEQYEHRERDVFVYGQWGSQFAEQFQDICSQDRPWFTLLHLFEVHCPRQTNGLEAKEHTVKQYDLAWQQLDSWIADLMAKMPANTITVLTADHGESIIRRSDHSVLGHLYRKLRAHLKRPRGPNDWRRHGYHVFEELIRIPWAMAGPGVPESMVIDDQVRQVDIVPTVLDVLGLSTPAGASGRSVLPLVRGQAMEEAPAYIESGCDDPLRDWHGIRYGGWKYAEHSRAGDNPCPEAVLLDYRNDPDERRNVIKKHPDTALDMRHRLDELMLAGQAGAAPGQQLSEDDQQRLTEQLKALGYI